MQRLAVDGGRPVRKQPFPARIMFGREEKKVVLEIMEKASTRGTEGFLDRYAENSEVDLYEKDFARYFGVQYATAVSSGTAAIHSALGALHLNPGTEVITSPITDPGTVSPILFQNCIPVFADVDYHTLNISPASIRQKITRKTKVIIPVHLAGQPCEMDEIMKIAKKYNLIVIEDCAQAHGAKYKGKYVGTIGDMGAFSLMSGKHMTSGGQGGMALTNNEEYYWDAKRFADRGKPFNSKEQTNLFLGLNYRMSQLEAVIGRVQLKRLEKIKKKRQLVVQSLQKRMQKELKAVRMWKIIDEVEANPWFCFLHYERDKMKVGQESFAKAVSAEGIPIGAYYGKPALPLYGTIWIKEKKAYGNSRYPWSSAQGRAIDYTHCCPIAEKALDEHMTLGIHECWRALEIEDTIKALKKVEQAYLK